MMTNQHSHIESGYAMVETAALMLLITPLVYLAMSYFQMISMQSDLNDAVSDLVHTSLKCTSTVQADACVEEALEDKVASYLARYSSVGCALFRVISIGNSSLSNKGNDLRVLRAWGKVFDPALKPSTIGLLNVHSVPSGTGLYESRGFPSEQYLLLCEVCSNSLNLPRWSSSCASGASAVNSIS